MTNLYVVVREFMTRGVNGIATGTGYELVRAFASETDAGRACAEVEHAETHTVPIGNAELLRLAQSIRGKMGAGISRGPRPGTGRKPKLAPCPNCGQPFGVVAMRAHKKTCA